MKHALFCQWCGLEYGNEPKADTKEADYKDSHSKNKTA